MKIIIRVIALLLVAGFVYLFSSFGSMAEPENFTIYSIIFGLCFAVASQAGLYLSTTNFGVKKKLVTTCLMLPFALLLVSSNYNMITGFIAGRPISNAASIAYIVGLAAYIYAFYQLIRVKPDAI